MTQTYPPSNETISLMHRHASVRAYTSDPLPTEVIESIVLAGQRASTSSNLQTWSVVAVTEPETRAELSRLCGDQAHIVQAPVFLAWCADGSLLDRACQRRGLPHAHHHLENFLMAAVDVALVMQNAAVAAESLGLGICYIGGIRNHADEVIKLLHLPPLVVPISGMTLGWPAREHATRPRLPLRAHLHWQRYDSADLDSALDEYDRTMVAANQFAGRRIPVPGRADEMEDYSWSEHSARRVSEPARVKLAGIVRGQGYDLR